jgi:hypothetical protein
MDYIAHVYGIGQNMHVIAEIKGIHPIILLTKRIFIEKFAVILEALLIGNALSLPVRNVLRGLIGEIVDHSAAVGRDNSDKKRSFIDIFDRFQKFFSHAEVGKPGCHQ